MCGIAYFLSGIIATYTIKTFKRRSVLITGHTIMSSMHIGVVLFDNSKNEIGILSMMVLFIFSYNMSRKYVASVCMG